MQRSIVSSIIDAVIDEERAILFGWLVPVRPEPIHNTAYNSHQPNTGAWFLDGPLRAFRECEHNKASVLWLQGKCQLPFFFFARFAFCYGTAPQWSSARDGTRNVNLA